MKRTIRRLFEQNLTAIERLANVEGVIFVESSLATSRAPAALRDSMSHDL